MIKKQEYLRLLLSTFVVLFIVSAINQIVFAQTFNVSNTQELRQTLQDAAGNGQSDVIVLADGTYKTTDDGGGTFTFLDNENYDLTIQGSSPENVVLSGDNTNQVLNFNVINFVRTITFANVSVINGNSETDGGGIYSSGVNLNIDNCTIFGNTARRCGGGFYSSGSFGTITITITNSTIFDNTASLAYGGGFYSTEETIITGSTISGNTANSGNGGGFYSTKETIITGSTISGNTARSYGGGFVSGNTTITGSTIADNTVTNASGGGFYSYESATISITDSTITNNAAGESGGGFYSYGSPTISITDSIITDNAAGESGGGFISAASTTTTITGNTITGNTATNRFGGGFSSSGSTIITGNTITGNTATNGSGGGFYSFGSTTITGNTITGNTAGDNGGGFVSGGNITGNTITGNTATNGSGGGFFSNGSPTITGNTITGNTATNRSGGGFFSTKETIITSSIITDNAAGESGGGFYSADIQIINSIIINNNATNGIYISSGTGNYILNSIFINNGTYDVTGSSGVVATIYNNYIDESKVNIQSFKKNNIFGGDLDFTYQANGDFHIGENSILIDTGTTDVSDVTFPESDMDGNKRVVGSSIDIGLYELSTTRPTIHSFTYSGDPLTDNEITFVVDAVPSDGRTITKYEIDFGNGVYSQGEASTQHIFDASGTYTIRAKVADSDGEYSEASLNITISIPPPPSEFVAFIQNFTNAMESNDSDAAKTAINNLLSSDLETSMFIQALFEGTNQAVTDAEAIKDGIITHKDQTITDLNTSIASMFTKAQLDTAILVERKKWDINEDGKVGINEAINALKIISGGQAE